MTNTSQVLNEILRINENAKYVKMGKVASLQLAKVGKQGSRLVKKVEVCHDEQGSRLVKRNGLRRIRKACENLALFIIHS